MCCWAAWRWPAPAPSSSVPATRTGPARLPRINGIQELQGATQQQDTRIRSLEDKVQGLTQSLSQATGANEELGHQIQLQNDKLDRMEKDFAYRLCTLSAQQLGANDAINCAARGHRFGARLPPVSEPDCVPATPCRRSVREP